MKHTREVRWQARVVVLPGHVPGSFWRMPTDLTSWTADMRDGLIARDGRVEPVSVDEVPAYVPTDPEARRTFWRPPGTAPAPRHRAA